MNLQPDKPRTRPIVEPWMTAAANEIDAKLGLPRFDSAVPLAAEIIAAHYAERDVHGPSAGNVSGQTPT